MIKSSSTSREMADVEWGNASPIHKDSSAYESLIGKS